MCWSCLWHSLCSGESQNKVVRERGEAGAGRQQVDPGEEGFTSKWNQARKGRSGVGRVGLLMSGIFRYS